MPSELWWKYGKDTYNCDAAKKCDNVTITRVNRPFYDSPLCFRNSMRLSYNEELLTFISAILA